MESQAIHYQSKAGFTLLELIVAITILTVAMSIAFQAFSSTLRGWKEAVKLLKAFIMVTLQCANAHQLLTR